MVETDATRSTTPGDTRRRAHRLLVAGLSIVVLTVAVLQTAVVPVLGIIADQLDASIVGVSWAVTANLLAAAAATPLIGRLADLHSKKRVLLVVLVVVLIGSLLAAMTSSLALLIVGRVLQAASYALYPISIAILREELPPERLMSAMSVLSGTLGFGGGTGLVVVGLLMSGDAGYHRVFWLTTAFTVIVIAIAVLVVPRRPRSVDGTIDWLGAAGLAAGLSAILLAITQGQSWGWTSPATHRQRGRRCRRAGRLVAAGNGAPNSRWYRRRCWRGGSMLLTNLATMFVGMGLYFAFLGLTQFVQIPREAAGYGFGATVLEASVVYLLPGAVTGFLVALISGRFIDRFGARPVLVVAAARGHRRVPVHRVRPFAGVADHRGEHPGQRLHQPGLRRAARPGGQRGRGRRDGCGHQHERHRPHDRQFDGGGAGRGPAEPAGGRHGRADGEQLLRHLHRGRRDRCAGDGAHRVVAPRRATSGIR